MKLVELDDRLVAHDAVNLAFAVTCGVAGSLVSESTGIGFLMAGSALTIGVMILYTLPLRRCVNRLVLAVAKAVG